MYFYRTEFFLKIRFVLYKDREINVFIYVWSVLNVYVNLIRNSNIIFVYYEMISKYFFIIVDILVNRKCLNEVYN